MDAQACCNENDYETSSTISTPLTSEATVCSSLESSLSSLDRENEPSTVAGAVQRILRLYHDLEAKPNLRPCPDVNWTFKDLVSTCLQPMRDEDVYSILADTQIRKLIPRLRELCSAGESELERFWSSKVAANLLDEQTSHSFDAIFDPFPYYTNYLRIAHIEASLICSAVSNPKNILFIGSGPLPLTSLLLAQHHFPHATFTNIDCDIHALAASKTLTLRLGLASRIRTLHAHAHAIPATVLQGSDVVYLAALVGVSSAEKSLILASVATTLKEGAVLIARSAHGLRKLLYPELEVDEVELRRLGLELVTEWIPQDEEVVNSVVVFRKVSFARRAS